jgi:hypothetical protein
MLGWLALLVICLYLLYGQKVTLDAYRHLRDPRRRYGYSPLLSPEEFTAEGERWRRRAVTYWYGGGALVAGLWLAVWLVQRR